MYGNHAEGGILMDAWETTLLAQQQAISEALQAEEEYELRLAASPDEVHVSVLLRWWRAVKKILQQRV